MKSTIYDVAKAAGVSIATVSKVVNQTGNISEKTRKRVLRIMEELQYQPSVVASALTGKKTSTFGLLLSNIANPFFAEAARFLEDEARAAGYSIVMCSTDNEDERSVNYLSLLQRKQVDGMIIACHFTDWSLLHPYLATETPVILFSKDVPSLNVHTVTVDDHQGGYQAIEYLIAKGHREIGIVAETGPSGEHRIRGGQQAMKEAGISWRSEWITNVQSSIQDGYNGARHMLEHSERPSAIFACNDMLAVGVLQAAQDLGLQVPNDLSIIGFDDTLLSQIVQPRLTTISQPISDMAHHTIQLLLRHANTPDISKQKVIFQPKLIEGRSTQSATPASNMD